MSFEQLEHQEYEQKKKKKLEREKSEQFFLEQQVVQESSKLLQRLASEIAAEFGIDIIQAKNLLDETTKNKLSNFSQALPSQLNTLQQQKLQEAIYKAKQSLRISSKEVRESLKKSLELEKTIGDDPGNLAKKLFSAERLQRAQHPQNMSDEVLGTIIGLLDSSEAVILFLYGLGKGILVTPYHLYLLATGKASYDGWKKI